MPLVLASIGDVTDTLMDRRIVIDLRRKKPPEQTDVDPVNLLHLHEPARDQIGEWCRLQESAVRATPIAPAATRNDRAGGVWVPLFAVATSIGGGWPSRFEQAYRKLTIAAAPELPMQLPTQLLMDIQAH